MEKLSRGRLHRRIVGAVIAVVGVIMEIFAIVRYTGPMSEMFSWEAPFSRYEWATIVSAILGVILFVIGLILFIVSFIRIGKKAEIPE